MKQIYFLLATIIVASSSLTSCSTEDNEDILNDTLNITEVIDNVTYEKSFLVDPNEILTDKKGFIIELSWQPAEFDVDMFMDTDNNASYNTGLKRYIANTNEATEVFSISNEDMDTYGFTLVHINKNQIISNSSDKEITYEMVIRRMSNKEVVKTINGTIMASETAQVFGSETPKGFNNLGRFIKAGNKFYFDYK
jgi:hypothetical protein